MHLARGTTSKVADRRVSSSILENRPFGSDDLRRYRKQSRARSRCRSRQVHVSGFISKFVRGLSHSEEQVGKRELFVPGGKDRRLERDRRRALSTERLNGHRVNEVSFS
jgi:hypothetical protein